MKSTCIVILVVLACLVILPFIVSCAEEKDEEDKSLCERIRGLDGFTFTSDLGNGTFTLPVYSFCVELFFAYRDGEVTIRRHPGVGHVPVDLFVSAPDGDAWLWNTRRESSFDSMNESLWQLQDDEWVDWTDYTSWYELSDIQVTSAGVGYFLVAPPKLFKYEKYEMEKIGLPDWEYRFEGLSSYKDLVAVEALEPQDENEDLFFHKGKLFVLRDGTWEEGPVFGDWEENFRFGDIAIVGDDEFWMWAQEFPSDEYNPNPWVISSYMEGEWQEIHQVDYEINGIFIDSQGRRILWGDTSYSGEFGYSYGHGQLAIYDGTEWTEVELETGENLHHVRYASMDSEDHIWFSGIESWEEPKKQCYRTNFRKPFIARYDGDGWKLLEIPGNVEKLLTASSDSETCLEGE